VEFDYTTLVQGGRPRPYLEIKIRQAGGTNEFDFYGIVDSGADSTAFPFGAAILIGLTDLSKFSQEDCGGATGETTGYVQEAEICVLGTWYRWKITFLPELNDNALLGRADFFRVFRVGFDELAQKFDITPHASND